MTSVAEAAATDWRNVAAFIIQLQRAATSSIDAFLEGRPEFIGIGKAVIAALLIPSERMENLLGVPAEG